MSFMMNSIFKLCRYTLSNKSIFQRLYHPICAVESVHLSKTKLCNDFNESTSQSKVPKASILLCVSLLTWLGFTKDDEEKESELIMTIKRAILCTQREEWTKAEQMLHLALRLAQEQQNQQGILYVYDIMANLALERGEADKAEMLFVNVLQRLLSEGMKQEDIKVIHISLKLARICHMKGDIEKAEIGFQWCLDTLKKNHLQSNTEDAIALYGVIQDWYAQLLLDKGKVNEALKHLKDAHRICSQVEGESSEKSILLLNDLGTASWKVGDLNTAQEYFNQAIRLGKNMEDFNYLGAIYANLGLVYLQKGALEQAKKHCKEGWRLGKKQKNNDVVEQANYCFEQIKSHI